MKQLEIRSSVKDDGLDGLLTCKGRSQQLTDVSAHVVSDYSFESDKGKVYLYDTFSTLPTIPYTPAPTASSTLPPSLQETSTSTTSPSSSK